MSTTPGVLRHRSTCRALASAAFTARRATTASVTPVLSTATKGFKSVSTVRPRDELFADIWDFADEVGPDVKWLWKPFIGEGLLTLLAAAPKAGKSTLLAHLLRAMLDGEPFWNRAV